jgi:hypothetical protein
VPKYTHGKRTSRGDYGGPNLGNFPGTTRQMLKVLPATKHADMLAEFQMLIALEAL